MAGQQREKIEGTRGRLLGYKDGGMGDYSLYIHSTNLLDGAACEGRVCHILGLVLGYSGKITQLDHRFWKKIYNYFLLSVHIYSVLSRFYYYHWIQYFTFSWGIKGSLPLAYKLKHTKYAEELKLEKGKYSYFLENNYFYQLPKNHRKIRIYNINLHVFLHYRNLDDVNFFFR